VSSNITVSVTAGNISKTTFYTAAATVSVQVARRRVS